jgi:hypothetical protein
MMGIGDWKRHDGSPAQEQDIADIAAGLAERGYSDAQIAASLNITAERLKAIMQAADELRELTLETVASHKPLPIH